MKKNLLNILIITSIGYGCSSTPEKDINKETPLGINPYNKDELNVIDGSVVYGELVKNGDRFEFANFYLNYPRDKKTYVNLNTLEPINLKLTEENRCMKSNTQEGSSYFRPYCDYENEIIFRKKRYTATDVARDTFGRVVTGAISFGIGALAYQNEYHTEFDKDQYNAALKQALNSIDRKKIIDNVNIYHNKRKELISATEAILNNINEDIRNSLQVKLKDKSGLFEGNEAFNYSLTKHVDLLPLTSQSFKNSSELLNIIEKDLNLHRAKSYTHVTCNLSLDDWNYTYNWNNWNDFCNKKFYANNQELNISEINIELQSKRSITLDFKHTYEDDSIKITKSHNSFDIENKTNHFITLNSFSFYMGDNIQSMTELDLQLPPRSVKNRALTYAQLNAQPVMIRNVTKSSLDQKINVGIAVKYRRENNIENTLFSTEFLSFKDMDAIR